ncbi:MAG: FMN-binding glutamate synthase family protein [Flavobacteriales bacterium]|nr:FMN-binding glutamate synthase family protein [Flavobacteriales bacterium]
MRKQFFITSIISIGLSIVLGKFVSSSYYYLLFFILPFVVLGCYDVIQTKRSILRNFPVLGHLRYIFESISPEIQQYFIERRTDGTPLSRNQRSLIYQRAKGVKDTHPFGTEHNLMEPGYEFLAHSIFPKEHVEAPRIKIGGPHCTKPYEAALLNISAMSFGALSNRAIEALNIGAREGGFYHNTGEGSISSYHLQGGDLVWQIGTGYFGCRTPDGKFDPEKFRDCAAKPEVKMIEIKLSQGAKPGHGGILPADKNTPEIAGIRGLKPYTTVFSPPGHSAFSNVNGLLKFVEQLRALSNGKPIGFKLCVGRRDEFEELCDEMVKTGITPDFISVDGAEGGTGAAPPEFADHMGIPLERGLVFVVDTLFARGLREHIKIICSGKIISGSSMVRFLALGADLCNSARAMMLAIGCIQAQRCNTNNCPTGVATQDPELIKGLDVKDKSVRVTNFQKNTVKAAMEIVGAIGLEHPDDLRRHHVIKNINATESRLFSEIYPYQDMVVKPL